MSNYKKLEEIKAKLQAELERPQPDVAKIQKFKNIIVMLGMGLGPADIKPYK